MFAALMLFALSLSFGTTLPACKPPPVPSDGSVVATPSGWTDTARTILDVLSWILPGARAIVNALLSTPARTQVGRAFDAVSEYTVRLHDAVAAYEARGGDRCAAQAAVAGLRVALVDLAQILADNGLAFGRPLERVLDSTAAIVDELLPGCVGPGGDAGWSSAGESSNLRLRAIEAGARQRGVSLRRDLDNIPHEQH